MIDVSRLRAGMTRDEVIRTFGEPEAVGGTSRKYPTPSCFKYDEIQIFFGPRKADTVDFAMLYHRDGSKEIVWPEHRRKFVAAD